MLDRLLPGYSRLDTASRLTVRRFAVTMIVAGIIATFAMPGYRLILFTAMTGLAVVVSAYLALRARDAFNAPTLNRWDETLAYIAVSILTA